VTVEQLRPRVVMDAERESASTAADDATGVPEVLQACLHELNELALTLTHIGWNVTGPDVDLAHTLLAPQLDAVRLMADAVAARITALGGTAVGTPGALVARRQGADYPIGRAAAIEHARALDACYLRLLSAQHDAISAVERADPITEDLLVEQTEQLESFHQFVRAHLEQTGEARSH